MLNIDDLYYSIENAKKSNKKYYFVEISNKDMKMNEIIIFNKRDFTYKQNYYKNAYNYDLTLKASNKIKILDFGGLNKINIEF